MSLLQITILILDVFKSTPNNNLAAPKQFLRVAPN
jgi:hypothetical protein